MSMKRVVGAAAVAASVGLSAMTQNAGFAYAVPLDPPCPNCNSGPGGGPQEPATTTVAPNTERTEPRSEPPSTQSSAAPSTQSSAAPSTQSTETQSYAEHCGAQHTKHHRAPAHRAPRRVQRTEHHRVQHRKHRRVQHTKHHSASSTGSTSASSTGSSTASSSTTASSTESTTASSTQNKPLVAPSTQPPHPPYVPQRRFRSGYCGNWRSRGCVCRLQHRGPRRAASAAGARVRLE